MGIRNSIKRAKSQRLVYLIIFIIFFVYALTLIYPLIWAFVSAMKTNIEYFQSPLSLPQEWHFENFVKAFSELEIDGNNMIMMTFNSLWFTVGGTVINIFISAMVAYVVSKYKFPGRNFIYSLAIFIMIIPIVGALPAQYKLVHDLGLANSPLYLLTCTGGFGFNFIILYAFFKNVSWSYAEAAFVDGASHFKIFRSVMLPQAMAPIVSLAIIQAIGLWNDYMTPILYLKDFPTLASGLYSYQTKIIYQSNYPIYFAGIVLSMLPVLVIFAIFQNTIMQNTVAGGLKG